MQSQDMEGDETMGKARGYAAYDAMRYYGYCVQVYRGGELVEEYRAGDSPHDSQVYGTGKTSLEQLLKYARQTAKDLKHEHGIKGPTVRDLTILEEPRAARKGA